MTHFNQVFQIQKQGPLKSSLLSSWDVSANMTPHLISAIVRNQLREHDAKPTKAVFFTGFSAFVCSFKDVGYCNCTCRYKSPTKRVHNIGLKSPKRGRLLGVERVPDLEALLSSFFCWVWDYGLCLPIYPSKHEHGESAGFP